MNICAKCKHVGYLVEGFGGSVPGLCMHPKVSNESVDVITGNTMVQGQYCTFTRAVGGHCGPAGTLFERKKILWIF